jgi:hypothetical protein
VIPQKVKFWGFNFDNGDLLAVINDEVYLNPEKDWQLKEYLPKKTLLKTKGEQYGYFFEIFYNHTTKLFDFDTFKENIEKYEIEKLVILVPEANTDPNVKNVYDYFYDFDWLSLEKKEKVENTTIIIFDVRL